VTSEGHELIDAGDGRRLERFGAWVVERPAPMIDEPPRDAAAWNQADLRFRRYAGWDAVADEIPESWPLVEGDLTFELRPTETGQVGLFPEQGPNRAWIRDAVRGLPSRPAILNLFAYTGATTLSAAAEGATVTHVDGSRPTVAWARRNAQLSGLEERPIRWIVDDADAFVGREIRRERWYDGVILDPPSYGHGRAGAAWRLEEQLGPLLDACASVTRRDPAFVVLSAHTPGFGPDRLADELAASFRRTNRDVEAGELTLHARSGAVLRLGAWARIIRG
jgi:23S rRNA (cytosine1962-C5)-methyltransferase